MTRFLLAFAALVLAMGAQAQQWPSKPVRVIVNVAPGGVADVTARVLGARLTETLGQPFVVENRAGGDGYIGRSEEHTSELQSLRHLVCRLLLGKKKTSHTSCRIYCSTT